MAGLDPYTKGCRTNYIPGLTEESQSLYEAYKKQYTGNPFAKETLESQVAHHLGTMPTVEGKPSLVSAFSEEECRKGIAALKNKAAGVK